MAEEYRLLSVEQALEMVLAQVQSLAPEETPLLEALGRVLAEDVYADTDIPPLSNSAMDGYALRAADLAFASSDAPARLCVIYNLAAGYTSDRTVMSGDAVRIMTGAPIPPGADTVVPFEETEVAGDQVQIARPHPVGHNVRRAGEDVRRGALILSQGSEIRPQEVGMLAALGRSVVLARRRPRVGILATGDEVIEIDVPLAPGKIRNANSYSNAAQVLAYGGIPVLLGIARDAQDAVAARVRAGLAQGLDLLLTSGGISVGDFDVVKRVLASEGEIGFWQVKMRPGKPLAFGQIGDGRTSRAVPLLGLPGNPVAAMVSCALFARPAILKMLGKRDWSAPTVQATLLEDVKGKAGFRYYLRVTLEKREGQYFARLTGEQGSGILLSMVRAQGLAIMPEDQAGLKAGQTVQVMLF
jgi:molybdopterin molybdotransferase